MGEPLHERIREAEILSERAAHFIETIFPVLPDNRIAEAWAITNDLHYYATGKWIPPESKRTADKP